LAVEIKILSGTSNYYIDYMDIETNNLRKTKPVIKGYTLKELKDYFSSIGEKKI